MKNPKVFCPDCNHPWLWHGRRGCHTGHAGKDGGCKCPNPRNLPPKVRQPLVGLICWAWPIMPRRLRLWAFMNDGPLKGDEDVEDKSYPAEPHIANMMQEVVPFFIRDGKCLDCGIPMSKHRVLLNDDVTDAWYTCWTEVGDGAHGKYQKHFCIRAEDSPEQTRM